MTGPRGGWPAAFGVAALAGAASLALPATLGYDAWAWTVWGRQLAHLDLATTAGPSFKPLPVLALAPLSVLGGATPVVWMGLMRAAAVLSLVLAYRVGARLAGPLAGAVAALSLALSADLYRTSLLGSAEPVLIALTLGAVDRHMAERRDWALVLVGLAGLIRPEAWVLLGLYGVYVWLREPALRPLAVAAVVLAPALWLGLDWIGSGNPLHASSTATSATEGSAANASVPALRGRPARGRRGHPPHARPRGGGDRGRGAAPRPRGAVARGARAGLDRRGRDHGRGRLHRHPALPRRARGGAVRPGGRGVRVAAGRRARAAGPPRRGVRDRRRRRSCPRSCAPARTRACSASRAARPHQRDELRRAVDRAGGRAAVLRAGRPAINPWLQTTLAWDLDVPLSGVQATWASSKRHPHWAPPALVFRAPARLAGPRPALPAGVTADTVLRSGRWRVLRAAA